jgi:hypothetical protein
MIYIFWLLMLHLHSSAFSMVSSVIYCLHTYIVKLSMVSILSLLLARLSMLAFEYVSYIVHPRHSTSLHYSFNTTNNEPNAIDRCFMFNSNTVRSHKCSSTIRWIICQRLLFWFNHINNHIHRLGYEKYFRWHINIILVTYRLNIDSRSHFCNIDSTLAKVTFNYKFIMFSWPMSNIDTRLFSTIIGSIAFCSATFTIGININVMHTSLDYFTNLADCDAICYNYSIFMYRQKLWSSWCLASR